MKKSVKSIVSIVSAIAMLSTSAMAVSAGTTTVNPIGNVNAIPCPSNDAMVSVTADVLVVNTATAKMEAAGLKLLQAQLKADRADQDAIVAKLSTMTTEEIKAAVSDVTAAAEKSDELKKAVEESAAEIKASVAAAEKAGVKADMVVTNVYNPLSAFAGGAVVEAAQKAVQSYVDEINSEIDVIAKNSSIVKVADISKVSSDTKLSLDSIKSGKDAADLFNKATDEQKTARNEGLNKVEVAKPAVTYKYGDLNNDGKVKAVDLVIMLQYQLSKDSKTPILSDETIAAKGYTIAAGDVYKDGISCDASDITRLKLFLLEDVEESVLGTVAF